MELDSLDHLKELGLEDRRYPDNIRGDGDVWGYVYSMEGFRYNLNRPDGYMDYTAVECYSEAEADKVKEGMRSSHSFTTTPVVTECLKRLCRRVMHNGRVVVFNRHYLLSEED